MGGDIPVGHERGLKPIRSRTCETYVGVSPDAKLVAEGIAVGYIHPPDVAYFPINDDEFAVVAIVDLTCQERKDHGEEGVHFYPFLLQLLEKTRGSLPAPHMIVDDTYLDPFAGFESEEVCEGSACVIIGEDIILYVDVFFGLSDVLVEVCHLGVPIGKDLEGVGEKGGRIGLPVNEL